MTISRRSLLITPAAAFGGQMLASQQSRGSEPAWFQRMRRAAFHNLNEYDAKVLDVERWLDYWASLKPNLLVLSCAGHLAFYPTRLPHHRRSQFLGSRDVFGEYFHGAKKRGFRVIARIETNWANEEVLKARPDWFERSEDGNPVPHAETPWIYRTCMFSTYHTEQVPAIMREVSSLYDVDGFFTNSWPDIGLPRRCWCQQCSRFQEDSRPQLTARHMDRILEICRLLDSVAKEKRWDRVYAVHIGGGIRAVQSIRKLAEVGSLLIADHQGRSGDRPIWDCAQQGRVAYSAAKGGPVALGTGTSGGVWRHTSKASAELVLWLAQAAASGMVPRYTWLGSMPEDRRWQEPGPKFFQWLARHEAHFYNKNSIADVGVVYSQRLNHLYNTPGATSGGYGARAATGPPAPGDPTEFMQGMYQALLEGRFVFDFVHEEDVGPSTLKKYRVLVLPNVALLSDEQCRHLRAWVETGGSLLATFETSLYNERGERRQRFGLGDVLGIEPAGGKPERVGAYFYGAIKQPRHPLLAGFSNTQWLPAGEYRVPVKAVGQPVMTVVPPYPRGIPEMVYAQARAEWPYPGTSSDEPAVVLREKGRSRLVYFPGDIDRSSWRTGNTDLSNLLQNALRWLVRDQLPVRVEGEGMAEVFAWETEPGVAIHVLNYNNPYMTRPNIRKNYPIGPQQVRVDLRSEARVSRVELLRAEKPLPFKQTGRIVEFVIPQVDDYEVAALYKA